MGGASSTLTAEQSAELTEKLKGAYEMCKADNLEDEIIQSTLQSEYKKIVEIYKSQPGTAVSSPIEPVKISKSGSDISRLTKNDGQSTRTARPSVAAAKETSVRAKPSRRRSFDPSVKKPGKENEVIEALKNISESKSLAALDVPATAAATAEPETARDQAILDVVDSWDSVTQQPFCTVCQMAFKSAAFLDRHVKYSDLHTKNVIKSQMKSPDAGSSDSLALSLTPGIAEDSSVVVVETASKKFTSKFQPKQQEGTHYRLLYTGSKFFWRNQRTVLLDLYVHILSLTIEVIAFDSDKHKEMNRIYLAADVLDDIVWESIAEEHETKVRNLHLADRFAEVDEEKLKQEMKLNKTISYILSRIQLGFGSNKLNTTTSTIIEFTKLHGDNFSKRNPVLDAPPIVLVPVGVTRRRRTNAEEIEATISSLHKDISGMSHHVEKARNLSKEGSSLAKASGSAERIAEYVYNAVNWMMKKKWYNAATVSPVRRKWIKAVRKVIRRSLNDRTKDFLKSKNIPYVSFTPVVDGRKMSTISPMKPRRTTIRATEL